VGLRERLVQVEVDDVETHVARAADPHDRVEVRAVVIERRPDPVHDPLDLLDPRLEQPERRGIGEHQARDVLVGLRAQIVEVDVAAGVDADLDDLVTGHRHRRRVRAVRGVGGQHLGPVLAAVLVERSRQQYAGKLALRPCARLERDVWEAGDLAERVLEAPHELERALRVARILERVKPRVAGQPGDPLVQLGVVLHRARAERVEAGVEIEVPLGQAVVVAHDLGLGDLGQAGRLGAPGVRREQLVERSLGHVELRGGKRPAAVLRALEDREGVVGLADHARVFGAAAVRSAAIAALSASARRSISARVRRSVIATSSPLSYSG
jgi:hypothetical protein